MSEADHLNPGSSISPTTPCPMYTMRAWRSLRLYAHASSCSLAALAKLELKQQECYCYTRKCTCLLISRAGHS